MSILSVADLNLNPLIRHHLSKAVFSHRELTEEDGHRLAAGADAGAGHRCHFHLVEDAGDQAFQHRGQHVTVHRLVDVVARLVVAAAAHTPHLFGYTE